MKKKNIDCIRLSALTPVLVLSVVMLTTINGSQNFVQAQNITSAVLPLQLPPQDGTSSPTMSTTPASSEDDSLSGSDSTTNSDDNTSTQDNTPISPASGTSDNDDESSGNNDNNNNDNDSDSSGSNDDDDNNNNDGDSQDTSSSGDGGSLAGTSDEDEEETEDALAKYGKSQAITQVNECGHGHTAMYVGCQNIDSQIQGDNNRVADAAAQSFGN